jgi:NhaP-type Na+/H+ or K+/H+ antiporter
VPCASRLAGGILVTIDHITETLALIAVLGLAAQWLGWRLRIPAIVLLVLSGLLVGPVLGIIRPSEALGDAFQPLIPTSALLAVVAFEYFIAAGAASIGHSLLELVLGLSVAAALGGLGGWLLGRAYLAGLVPEYLKGPMALATALGLYALSNLFLEESGLVAATMVGLVIGNMGLPGIGEIRRFKENVAVLLVSGIFLLLTADLDPEILGRLDWRSFALIAAVLFLVRPLAIWLATVGAGMSWQERTLVGWIAPCGVLAAAVAGIFGPAVAAQGYAGGDLLLPLVFALILVTVVVHGFSLAPWPAAWA